MIAAGGCVALNAGFEESDGSTGGAASSDTGRNKASESDSEPSAGGSAVTTVTAGESNGSDTSTPTDSGVTTVADTGGPPPVSSSGESSGESTGGLGTSEGESGGDPCGIVEAGVSEDAFLVECPEEDECDQRNYGQSLTGSLAQGDAAFSGLLLEFPVTEPWADHIDVTLDLLADSELAGTTFTISVYPVDVPCIWNEGPEDESFLDPGEAGVTYSACNGDPAMTVPWPGGAGGVLDYVDPSWSIGTITLDPGDYLVDAPFGVVVALERPALGSTPEALMIVSDIPFLGELVLTSGEGGEYAPFVEVFACPDLGAAQR